VELDWVKQPMTSREWALDIIWFCSESTCLFRDFGGSSEHEH